jgi:hypothetical protein
VTTTTGIATHVAYQEVHRTKPHEAGRATQSDKVIVSTDNALGPKPCPSVPKRVGEPVGEPHLKLIKHLWVEQRKHNHLLELLNVRGQASNVLKANRPAEGQASAVRLSSLCPVSASLCPVSNQSLPSLSPVSLQSLPSLPTYRHAWAAHPCQRCPCCFSSLAAGLGAGASLCQQPSSDKR